MNRDHIVAQAKADALRQASSMLDGGTAAARMLARMAGEYETVADAAAQQQDGGESDVEMRRLTALWRFGKEVLPCNVPSFEGFVFALDSQIDRVCPRPNSEG